MDIFMSHNLMDQLSEEINKKLGDRPFYTIRQLISIGLFGSMHAARVALKKGQLTFVKISPRRSVIPRSVVLAYLNANVHSTSKDLSIQMEPNLNGNK